MHLHFFANITEGIYLDVASNHYKRISNTYFFDRCLGWRGVCVEPNPIYHSELIARRSCELVPTCASEYAENATLILPAQPWLGGLGGINGGKLGAYKFSTKALNTSATLTLPCVRVGDELERLRIRHVDFFSLDVEGHESAVLRGIDFCKVSIAYILCEDNCAEVLTPLGYVQSELPLVTGEDRLWRLPPGIEEPLGCAQGTSPMQQQKSHAKMTQATGPDFSVWAGTSLVTHGGAYASTVELISRLMKQSVEVQRITVNYHEGTIDPALCGPTAKVSPKLRCSAVGWLKANFWKQVFTPHAVQAGGFTHLWLFDSDLQVVPFDLLALLQTMHALGAAIVQPAILPPAPGGRSTDIDFLRADHNPISDSCIASEVPIVEITTPVIDIAAWSRVIYPRLLLRWPEEALRTTDHFINDVWCGLIAAKMQWGGLGNGQLPWPCILSRSVRIVHFDTRLTAGTRHRHSPNMSETVFGRLVMPWYAGTTADRNRFLGRARCFSRADVANGTLGVLSRSQIAAAAKDCHEARKPTNSLQWQHPTGAQSCSACIKIMKAGRPLNCAGCIRRGVDCDCTCPGFDLWS